MEDCTSQKSDFIKPINTKKTTKAKSHTSVLKKIIANKNNLNQNVDKYKGTKQNENLNYNNNLNSNQNSNYNNIKKSILNTNLKGNFKQKSSINLNQCANPTKYCYQFGGIDKHIINHINKEQGFTKLQTKCKNLHNNGEISTNFSNNKIKQQNLLKQKNNGEISANFSNNQNEIKQQNLLKQDGATSSGASFNGNFKFTQNKILILINLLKPDKFCVTASEAQFDKNNQLTHNTKKLNNILNPRRIIEIIKKLIHKNLLKLQIKREGKDQNKTSRLTKRGVDYV